MRTQSGKWNHGKIRILQKKKIQQNMIKRKRKEGKNRENGGTESEDAKKRHIRGIQYD